LHTAKLLWVTPDADKLVAYMARVSNPANQNNEETAPRLIRYLIRNRHWSPFEMVNACVEIETTRDIGRQLLRHRSFTFQEFSGRYAAYEELLTERECRLQDTANRQNSLMPDDVDLKDWFVGEVERLVKYNGNLYKDFLEAGIAKEVARAILPEGLVPTRMYMNGTVRSWIHYVNERTEAGVQKEHRLLAESIKEAVFDQLPQIKEAVWGSPLKKQSPDIDLSQK